MSNRHMVVPDTQVQPGDSFDHLRHAGEYAAEKKPEVIIHLGDHWDMPSLSTYDKGTRGFEGRRYSDDIAAGIEGMKAFLAPIRAEQKRLKKNNKKRWKPRMIFLLGNHEYRIERACEKDAMLDGVLGFDDLQLEEMGWEVYPFLEVVNVDGVCYSHYFTSGVMGRPVSSARAMVTKKMQSCVMGHVQDRDIAYARRADGTNVTGIFGGIFYPGDQTYLNPQTNASWRGVWMLHDVHDGSFDEMPVSMSYLEKKYANNARS